MPDDLNVFEGRNLQSLIQDDTANATLEKTYHSRAKQPYYFPEAGNYGRFNKQHRRILPYDSSSASMTDVCDEHESHANEVPSVSIMSNDKQSMSPLAVPATQK